MIPLSFDLFIYYKDQFLCYAKSNSELQEEKLIKLKKQKVAKFFIPGDQEQAYQEYLDQLLENSLNSDNVSIEDKADVVQGAGMSAVEELQKDPASEKSYNKGKKASQGVIDSIRKNPEILKHFFKEGAEDDFLVASCVSGMALVSRMSILKNYPDEKLAPMALGTLLRDISASTFSEEGARDWFRTPLDEISKEHLKVYLTHPEMSAKMLQDKPFADEQVLKVILSHEEKLQGQGFPRKLQKLTDDQEIVSLCCAYDRLVSCLKVSPKEAVKKLSVEELGNYNLENLNFLKKMLKEDGLL